MSSSDSSDSSDPPPDRSTDPSSDASSDPSSDPADVDDTRELDLIERLAVALVDNLAPDDPDEPEGLSIGILPADDGLSVAVRPLLGPDPVASLIGFTAPAQWIAVGVVSTARWASISDDEAASGRLRRSRRPSRGRARLAHVVTRPGASLVVLRQDHDPPLVRWFDPRDEQIGRIDDVCRRILGLPTSPPTSPTVELWTVLWLDAVVRLAAVGELSTWRAVAEVHPVVERLTIDDPVLRAAAADDLVELGAGYGDLLEWEDLRELCALGEWPVVDVDPDDAEWMDAGMFCRWSLASHPDLTELLGDVDALLPDVLSRRVRTTCRAWGLP